MAMNDLTVEQSATVLNAIVTQATGGAALASLNTKDFISVAQVALKTGYDTIMNSVSQVLTKTVFPMRRYDAKFKGIEVTSDEWGNRVRKINAIDSEFENGEFDIPADGQSVDMYKIKRPKVLETNFYSSSNFEYQHPSIFLNQLNTAFSSAEELGKFWAMLVQNTSNHIEQSREAASRAALANFIAGKVAAGNNVIHCLTEYNTLTGLTLDEQDVMQPSNYPAFIKWLSGRIEQISSMMTERLYDHHINVTGKEILRHTPVEDQRVYLSAPFKFQAESRVLADTYHDNFVKFADKESVNFWQNPKSPTEITVKPVYLKAADGTLINATADTEVENLIGVIFDKDAIGMNLYSESVDTTPINARGKYYNMFFHYRIRYWNDFTENGVVLLLD